MPDAEKRRMYSNEWYNTNVERVVKLEFHLKSECVGTPSHFHETINFQNLLCNELGALAVRFTVLFTN